MAKSKGINKIVAGALALAVAAGTICCLGYASRDNDGNWFGGMHWADNVINNGIDNNGGTIIADGEANGMLLSATAIPLNAYEEYGVSALAENAYSLSVTYTPADTTYQATTYTCTFADGSDCSAYATVTQSEEGSKTATLTILQAFDKQIIVTATCDRNPEIKATTTVDYVGTVAVHINSDVSDIESGISIRNYFTNGTICPDLEGCLTISFNMPNDVSNGMREKGYNLQGVEYTFTPEAINTVSNTISVTEVFMRTAGFTNSTPTTAEEKAYWQALSSVILAGREPDDCSGDTIFRFSITSHRTYNGVYYDDIYVSVEDNSIYLNDYTGFEVVAESMETNSPSIVTG